jgi:HAE1 family hydrophobic/amphiphilic exporter-1
VLVLLLFLKDLRATLVIAAAIPISIIATFFLMYQTGTSLNIMSLGGLALGVGMLVDCAIVVLEAIVARREAGADALSAARAGAAEVGRAVIASTLTTVAVFVPVVFLEGIAAQLFRDQPLTVSFSLLASLAVSLTLIPMLTALHASPQEPPTSAPETGSRVRRAGRLLLVSVPTAGLRGLRRLGRGLGRLLAIPARPVSATFDRSVAGFAAAYPAANRPCAIIAGADPGRSPGQHRLPGRHRPHRPYSG